MSILNRILVLSPQNFLERPGLQNARPFAYTNITSTLFQPNSRISSPRKLAKGSNLTGPRPDTAGREELRPNGGWENSCVKLPNIIRQHTTDRRDTKMGKFHLVGKCGYGRRVETPLVWQSSITRTRDGRNAGRKRLPKIRPCSNPSVCDAGRGRTPRTCKTNKISWLEASHNDAAGGGADVVFTISSPVS